MAKLFVGGFPLDIDELTLVKLFAPYGDVSTIKIVRDRKTHICKGYAFLEMVNEEAAENAKSALNGTEVSGRELKVNIVEEKKTTAPARINTTYRKVERYPVIEKKKRPRRTEN